MVDKIIQWFVSLLYKHGYIVLHIGDVTELRKKPEPGDLRLLEKHILKDQEALEVATTEIRRLQEHIAVFEDRITELEKQPSKRDDDFAVKQLIDEWLKWGGESD